MIFPRYKVPPDDTRNLHRLRAALKKLGHVRLVRIEHDDEICNPPEYVRHGYCTLVARGGRPAILCQKTDGWWVTSGVESWAPSPVTPGILHVRTENSLYEVSQA